MNVFYICTFDGTVPAHDATIATCEVNALCSFCPHYSELVHSRSTVDSRRFVVTLLTGFCRQILAAATQVQFTNPEQQTIFVR